MLNIKQNDGTWITGRTVFTTFQVRAKIVMEPQEQSSQTIKVDLKGMEFTLFDILKGSPDTIKPVKEKEDKVLTKKGDPVEEKVGSIAKKTRTRTKKDSPTNTTTN